MTELVPYRKKDSIPLILNSFAQHIKFKYKSILSANERKTRT